ncbi:hypothetical protein KUCAC02_033003, partial [Chaenocephalus aceratus]
MIRRAGPLRFGPYGIPITVLPRRDDRVSRPLMISLPEVEASTKQEEVSPPPPPRSKLPPLFQEGAPYPPPLFLRDTYNQALPQPLLRKIRRPKRRYRCEEPTSIMNAIKLRPARESRRGPVELKEEASRRRRAAEGPVSAEVKRLRGDDRRPPNDRRPPSGIHVSSSALPTSSRVLRGGASGPPNQRVHFTRRLQSTPPSLPPRMRLKPQRVSNRRPAQLLPWSPCSVRPCVPPRCSSPPSECSSTETFDLPPPGPALLDPLCPASSSPRANETLADGEDEGGDLKRRCKSSMSPPPVEGEEEEARLEGAPPRRALAVLGDIVWAKISGFPWWPAR